MGKLKHWVFESFPQGYSLSAVEPGFELRQSDASLSAGKESTCNAGDTSSIPGLGRSPGEGKSYPFQYSGLENSMDSIVHGVTKSWTWLSDFHLSLILKCNSFPLLFLLFYSLPLCQIATRSLPRDFAMHPRRENGMLSCAAPPPPTPNYLTLDLAMWLGLVNEILVDVIQVFKQKLLTAGMIGLNTHLSALCHDSNMCWEAVSPCTWPKLTCSQKLSWATASEHSLCPNPQVRNKCFLWSYWFWGLLHGIIITIVAWYNGIC